jgi:hypothetical protein
VRLSVRVRVRVRDSIRIRTYRGRWFVSTRLFSRKRLLSLLLRGYFAIDGRRYKKKRQRIKNKTT